MVNRVSRRAGARITGACAVGVVAAGLLAGVSPAASPVAHSAGVQLTGGHDTDLGGGIALIMGPSMISTPSQQYVDTVEALYLQPHGFTGTAVALTTPESPYNLAESTAAGSQILTEAVQAQIATGQVDADNPVVVFGYSQSAAFVSQAMETLHEQGVPSDYVHFVLVGDPAAPNGGWLTSLTPPGEDTTVALLNVPLGNPTPTDLYPADIYTLEYDGYADHPHYPLNLLSLLNSYMGLMLQHLGYLGLDPDRVANAVELPTSDDSLANFYMIPAESLPLLDPLKLIPVIGEPLYELLEPNTRLLVDLGYGSINEGWDQGPADVQTMGSMLQFAPADLNWTDVFIELSRRSTEGVANFMTALLDPDTYSMTPVVESEVLEPLVAAAYGAGIIATPAVSSVAALVGAFLAATSDSLVDPVVTAARFPAGAADSFLDALVQMVS